MRPTILPPAKVGRGRFIAPLVKVLETIYPNSPIRVRVEIARPDRTERENNYLWGVPYKMLQQETGANPNDLHELNCGEQWGWKDEPCAVSPRNPDGVRSVPVRTSTRNMDGVYELCDEEDFLQLWLRAQEWGANVGLVIPDPDPKLRTKR